MYVSRTFLAFLFRSSLFHFHSLIFSQMHTHSLSFSLFLSFLYILFFFISSTNFFLLIDDLYRVPLAAKSPPRSAELARRRVSRVDDLLTQGIMLIIVFCLPPLLQVLFLSILSLDFAVRRAGGYTQILA